MRAVEIQAYGGPEVLRLVRAAGPEPGPGQVISAGKPLPHVTD
ncbi:hypothetical protein [Streptomyces sp. NPDC058989]